MRTPVGFLLPMNNQNNTFEKPPLSIEAQLERLSSRGVIIQDQETAKHYLTYISYYRFCGLCY
jgi:abortive infection bacteriophage resistance protein